MELTAVIEALKAIKTNRKYKIVINTDSKLIVSAFNQGWLEKWEKKNWYRNRKDKVINSDLWIKATELVKIHEVEFRWVPGHAGIEENERCDQLANIAAQQPGLPADAIYEKEKESDIFVGDDSM